MLPVPLNSSKMTSSMRLPVSISAVAMIVREPPSSTLRAAARKLEGVGINTAGEDLAGGRRDGVIGASQPGNGVEQHDNVAFMLDKALGFLKDHFGHLDVALRRLIEG